MPLTFEVAAKFFEDLLTDWRESQSEIQFCLSIRQECLLVGFQTQLLHNG
jgi:hypothetical protein